VRPRKDQRGVDLISYVLPFGRLWYGEPNAVSNAIGYAKFFSRSHDAVIHVYDEAGNVIETHEHTGEFKEWRCLPARHKRNRELVNVAPRQLSEEVPDRSRPLLLAEFLKPRIVAQRVPEG
jgi:hypothetical protein